MLAFFLSPRCAEGQTMGVAEKHMFASVKGVFR